MIQIPRVCSRAGVGLLVLSGWLPAALLPAQDRAAPAPSLRMVPADAATYSVGLRTREQLDAIRHSKAWARLMSLPVVKTGWQMVEAEWANPGGKLAQVRSWYEQPANADLIRFLGELFEEEVFTYGAKNTADFTLLLQEVQAANQFAPLIGLLKEGPHGVNRPELRGKIILQVLAAHPERLKIPDMVMGFKLTRTKEAQITNWIQALRKALVQAAPPLKERMKKARIQGADVYSLVLGGDMIPWDDLPLAQFEDQPGEFGNLVKRLKEMKLTVAVTVRGNYLLVSMGEGTVALAAVGDGLPNRLSDRPELAPLAKFSDRRLTAITYVSKDFSAAAVHGREAEDTTAWLSSLIKDSGLPADKQAKIVKDLKDLSAGWKRPPNQAGAVLSFSFLTKRGAEDYSYDWGQSHDLDGAKALTLLKHVGSRPLGFVVSRERASPDQYEFLVRLITLGHQYFDELVLPQLPEQARQPYEEFMKEAKPLFGRLNRATGKLLLPSLDGQSGIVLGADWKSKQWHQAMPMADKELPLPEIAVVFGVRDAAKLRQAFQEYRAVYNGLVDAVAKVVPGPLPDIKLPEPKSAKIKQGTLYSYPVPKELGLDPRIVPTGGLSQSVAVFTLSHDQAQRLLTTTTWKAPGGPLADPKRKLASAGYFDCAGFIDLVSPWVEYALTQAHQGNEVLEQVHTFMEVLKVVRSHASATYIENGVVVTHGETIVRDLER